MKAAFSFAVVALTLLALAWQTSAVSLSEQRSDSTARVASRANAVRSLLIERSGRSNRATAGGAASVNSLVNQAAEQGATFKTAVMSRSAAAARDFRWDVPPTPNGEFTDGGSTVVLNNLNSLEAWEPPPSTNMANLLKQLREASQKQLQSEESEKKQEHEQLMQKEAQRQQQHQQKLNELAKVQRDAELKKVLVRPDLQIITPQAGRVLWEAMRIEKVPQFTYMFWLRPKAIIGNWGGIIHKGMDQGQRNPAVWFYPGSTRLHIRSGVEGNPNDGGDPEDRLRINRWTHVAFSHRAGEFKVYLNGKLKLTRTDIKAPLLNDGPLWAPLTSSAAANAELTDLRVLPRIASLDEIRAVRKERAYRKFTRSENSEWRNRRRFRRKRTMQAPARNAAQVAVSQSGSGSKQSSGSKQ